VKKALAKDREERYQLAKDFLTDLKSLRQEQEPRTKLVAAGPVNLKDAAPVTSELQHSVSTAEQLTTRTGEGANVTTASDVKGHRRNAIHWTIAISVMAAVTAAAFGFYHMIANRRSRSVAPFQTMKMTRLNNAGDGGAVISPDGKYIAYMMYGTATNGLWLRQTVTDSAVRLLPDVSSWGLNFTKDSNYAYCTVGGKDHPDGALYKVPALGGPAKLVLEGITGWVSFSPDGNRMVFKRNSKETGKSSLITANADGGDERIILLGNLRYTVWAYDWSPDGKSIALSVRNDTAPSTSQVLVVPATGGEERPILPPQREFITAITWVPDGSGLIMVAVDKTTRLPQLWRLSYPGGQVTRITNDSNWYTGGSITSDGDTILATRYAVGGQSIWIGDAGDLNSLRKTTNQGDCVNWTPDGKVLYIENEDGKIDLWMMKADTSERQRLTHDQSRNDWPMMSPDRRYIVFSSWRSGSLQIWRMDSDGRNLKQLTVGINECSLPKITADSKWVVYSTWIPPSGGCVKKIPLDGGESVTLADEALGFTISPDGKMLAYQSFDKQKKHDVIVVRPMDGGEPVKVIDFPDYPIFRIEQWIHDRLFCISRDSTQIILLPLDGHRPREYYKTNDRIFSFAISPDGARIAISRGVSAYETVMITDIKDRGQ
jgi:Tol biopolymer transport system component